MTSASGGARSTPATAASSSTISAWGTDITWNSSSSGTPSRMSSRICPRRPSRRSMCTRTAAVLCATAGGECINFDCHRSSFLVVFVCTGSRETFTCIYSSDSGAWNGPTSVQLRHASVGLGPSVLSGNALYYMSHSCGRSKKILNVDLSTREASLIRLPSTPYRCIQLTAMVDGGLGFIAVHESKLHLWSRESGSKAYAGWTHNRVVELDTLLGPVGIHPESIYVLHIVDGIGALFVGTKDVFVILDLKSFRIRKLYEGRRIYSVVLYMSFYTPAFRAACTEGPKVVP